VPTRGRPVEPATTLAGLAASTADHVLFLDDDVWLAPGTVARLHEAIVELGCGLVGCAVTADALLRG